MSAQQNTTADFTFAPGETSVVGDRFSPSVILFWLKTSVAASTMRVQYKSPNTLLGIIPLGTNTQTIPLRNIASVDTSTKFNLGSLIWGLVFLFVGLGCMSSSVGVAIILILLAVANFVNVMNAKLDFVNQAGGANSITVSILEKDRLMQLAQEIQKLVFADVDQLRHQESMHLAQQRFVAQAASTAIQQQMLDNQRKSMGQDRETGK